MARVALVALVGLVAVCSAYERIEDVESCLKKAYYPVSFGAPLKTSKTQNLEGHARDIKTALKEFQGQDRTKGQNFEDSTYGGPTLEELWTQDFGERPLEDFGGYVPLFVQWVTTKMRGKKDALHTTLKHVLAKDILYVTVSNHAFGIKDSFPDFEHYPNILVLSAGGNGHIPVPHLKRNIPYQGYDPNFAFKYDISFVGTPRVNGGRKKFLDTIAAQKLGDKGQSLSLEVTQKPFLESLTIYNNSMMNLAPRGVGRTSFRLYEIIHVGKLPAYIYSDIAWVPYEGTGADMRTFGWVFQNEEAEKVGQVAWNLKKDPADLAKRLQALHTLRDSHYSYEGVVSQISLYLKGGEGASDLRCHGYPTKG